MQINEVVNSACGKAKEPNCIEVQTAMGRTKVEASIFKGLIESSDGIFGVELKGGIKIANFAKSTPDGKVAIYNLPIESTKPRENKDISIFVEGSNVNIDSRNEEVNTLDVHNKNGDVFLYKDDFDAVRYTTENEHFSTGAMPSSL